MPEGAPGRGYKGSFCSWVSFRLETRGHFQDLGAALGEQVSSWLGWGSFLSRGRLWRRDQGGDSTEPGRAGGDRWGLGVSASQVLWVLHPAADRVFVCVICSSHSQEPVSGTLRGLPSIVISSVLFGPHRCAGEGTPLTWPWPLRLATDSAVGQSLISDLCAPLCPPHTPFPSFQNNQLLR